MVGVRSTLFLRAFQVYKVIGLDQDRLKSDVKPAVEKENTPPVLPQKACIVVASKKCCQVLEVIQKIGCPPPIKDVCPEPEEEEVAPVKMKTEKAPVKKKAAQNAKKSESNDASPGSAKGTYCAGKFRETYRKYVSGKVAEGLKLREAQRSWKESDVRSQLLSALPQSELKKRKFI